ncbi:MAG: (d)CMP kinase, partial [Bacilli bacterium]|nr:(d)CMP kinase [Bacilli bacterium]
MNKIIAIDGPAGSGKGTVAAKLAEKLNLVNIDTGATYRCVALAAIRNDLGIDDIEAITDLSSRIDIKLTKDGKVFLDGEDVTREIRDKAVTNIVSQISSIVKIRENMVKLQRKFALDSDVVMEGRDITT